MKTPVGFKHWSQKFLSNVSLHIPYAEAKVVTPDVQVCGTISHLAIFDTSHTPTKIRLSAHTNHMPMYLPG